MSSEVYSDNWFSTNSATQVFVKIQTNTKLDNIQKQLVTAGNGFCSENERRLFFGLGENTKVDSLVIQWPSGIRQIIRHPAIDQEHKITETK